MTNFWNSKDKTEGLLGNNSNCDPDLRTEFDRLIQGYRGCEGIGQLMILRKLDKTKRAHGYDEIYGGSTNDPWDQREEYQWSEKYVLGHFTQTYGRALTAASQADLLHTIGRFDNDKAMAYLQSDSDPKVGDKLFRLRTLEDGSTYYPVDRIETWRITHVEDRRQEKRKIAFFIVLLERIET